MSEIIREADPRFDVSLPVIIVGAGAAGLTAALACKAAGVEPLVLERDALPRGSTALSAGLIPAPGSRWQQAAGIEDSPDRFLDDVRHKTGGTADMALAALVAREAAPTLEWLADAHGLAFSLLGDVGFPGHSRRRLHGLPSRSGAELIDRLRAAAEAMQIPLLTGAHVRTLIADAAGWPRGLLAARPDGRSERLGFGALVLACNGYGGNRTMVAEHIPQLKDALYFGHVGNQGDAVAWGRALGARLRDLSGHQGHASVAMPHGILITWIVIMEGGFQVNRDGRRFSDESLGYSEQAAKVLAEPEGLAWNIFDGRIAALARQFEDFKLAEQQGAILTAATPELLASRAGLPVAAVLDTMAEIEARRRGATADAWGRRWTGLQPLAAPYHAVRVTGALFHTQGGLVVDDAARVLREDREAISNLFAAGGAAVGISGPQASGYLSGNGLMTAVTLGRIAGRQAAAASGG